MTEFSGLAVGGPKDGQWLDGHAYNYYRVPVLADPLRVGDTGEALGVYTYVEYKHFQLGRDHGFWLVEPFHGDPVSTILEALTACYRPGKPRQ